MIRVSTALLKRADALLAEDWFGGVVAVASQWTIGRLLIGIMRSENHDASPGAECRYAQLVAQWI